MSCMSQNFRLFHVSNLSVRNFRIFLLMYPGSVSPPESRPRVQHSLSPSRPSKWPSGAAGTRYGDSPRGPVVETLRPKDQDHDPQDQAGPDWMREMRQGYATGTRHAGNYRTRRSVRCHPRGSATGNDSEDLPRGAVTATGKEKTLASKVPLLSREEPGASQQGDLDREETQDGCEGHQRPFVRRKCFSGEGTGFHF